MAMVLKYALILGGVYLIVCLLVLVAQERLIFVGAGQRGAGMPELIGVEVRRVPFDGGLTCRVAVDGAVGQPRAVVLMFGGNGEDLRWASLWLPMWRGYGTRALLVEYPGYGDSDGSPSKASMLAAAVAGHRLARELAAAAGVPLVVCGSSLGSFAAVHVAADGGADGLVLRAPPTTLAAAGRDHFPILPVGLLLRHDFDNLARAPAVRCPTLVVHGDRDRTVATRFGRELAAAIPGAELLIVPGAGHNDLSLERGGPAGEAVERLLAAAGR